MYESKYKYNAIKTIPIYTQTTLKLCQTMEMFG